MEGTEDARKVCGASGKHSGNARSRAMAAGSPLPAHRSNDSLVRQYETPRQLFGQIDRSCGDLSQFSEAGFESMKLGDFLLFGRTKRLQVLPQNKIKLISSEKKLPQLFDFIWPPGRKCPD